ncbi:MAG: hypothetical protein OXC11_14800 [Rhodospirillales bacterium]|nr:hypothetical protein [Rhodospirillales bacterium]
MATVFGLYQVNADSVGNVFACFRPKDKQSLYVAASAMKNQQDPDKRAELLDRFERVRKDLTRNELCGLLQTDAVTQRWDTDEEYPALIGARNVGPFGRPTGRTYWTRLDWLEPAEG